MNIEITDLDNILNYLETTSLEPHDDYSSEFTYKEQKILYKYIKQLQQENKQLKMINKEYERLNKEKNRGFKITNVQEYNIDKLLSYKKYKDNWNKLKKQEIDRFNESQDVQFLDVLQDMQELEQGSDSNDRFKTR